MYQKSGLTFLVNEWNGEKNFDREFSVNSSFMITGYFMYEEQASELKKMDFLEFSRK